MFAIPDDFCSTHSSPRGLYMVLASVIQAHGMSYAAASHPANVKNIQSTTTFRNSLSRCHSWINVDKKSQLKTDFVFVFLASV